MATTHGNYSPPCGLILHEVCKCSSEAELHLNGAESCILKLGGKLASPVLDKPSVSLLPQASVVFHALCPVLSHFPLSHQIPVQFTVSGKNKSSRQQVFLQGPQHH